MNKRDTQILLWILHMEDREMQHIPAVTRLDIMDGASLDPHPDGLFSTKIFGAFGNELRDVLFGKIDLKVRIIHPKIYRDLMSLRQLYKSIVDGTQRAVFVKSLGDYVAVNDDDPKGDTGFGFFVSNLTEMRFKRSKSVERNEKINEIERWRHRLTTKNFPVIPAGLRDIEMSGDHITKNEINDLYYRLLASSSVIVASDDMESSYYDANRRNIQNVVNEIYQYLESLVGGKRGYMRDKFLSRRVMDSTRNVITAMDASGKHLDSPNVPGFDSTVLGLYQASRMFAPLVLNWLRSGPLAKLLSISDTQIPLVHPDTLKEVWVDVTPETIDAFTSEEGLMGLITLQESVDARHAPVTIDDHYLALVYLDGRSFKVFDHIDQVPDEVMKRVSNKEASIHPITLEELIYYSGYGKFSKKHEVNTRYPTTDDNSIYPTKTYVKTTTTSLALRELDHNWEYVETESNLAPEWPMPGVHSYHDSHSPHSGRLSWSGAD